MRKHEILIRYGSGLLSSGRRPLPNFLIIGAQKAGTSSLFGYLVQHPEVLGSFIKEVQFFTRRYALGERGYRAFFPKLEHDREEPAVGESTPQYLFDERVPERVARMLPGARLVVLVREPVERAYSHYKHNCRKGLETRSFEEAVAEDLAKLNSATGIGRAEGEPVEIYRHHSYLRRGFYAEQLRRWLKHFPDEQIKVFRAENFFSNPAATVEESLRFLGLPPLPLDTSIAFNRFDYERKRSSQFPELARVFESPNAELKNLTGIEW